MEIRFVDRNNELTQIARETASRRLAFALSRFGQEIQNVNVLAEDINGPRGGGKRCVVRVELRRHRAIEASHEGTKFGECLVKTIDRIGRSVARKLEIRDRFARDTIRTTSG